MRHLLCVLILGGCHASLPAAASQAVKVVPSDCGPEIPGFDLVAGAPAVLLGEMHGLVGPSEFALDLACRMALQRSEAVLALEMPKIEQGRLDVYLASEGTEPDRAHLLAGRNWTHPFQSGGTSQSRFEMLEHARRLLRAGLRLRVVAVIGGDAGPPAAGAPRLARWQQANVREKAMADAIVTLVGEKRGPVILLVGETHVQGASDPETDPNIRWTGMLVREQIPQMISLRNRYDAGEAWSCIPVGEPPRPECGRHQLAARDPGSRTALWNIALFDTPSKDGINGTFDTGPAHPSDPAIFLLSKPAP
jgi:hypothetical protein